MEPHRGRVTVKLKQYLQPLQSTKLREVQRCPYAPAMHASHRCGVVLADGDGGRLRELTQRVWGDRPKQSCPILSGCTLLEEETRRCAERIIPCEQILFSVIQYVPDVLPSDVIQQGGEADGGEKTTHPDTRSVQKAATLQKRGGCGFLSSH